jgi:hypothetical protein
MLKTGFEQLIRSLEALNAIESVLYPSLGVTGISNDDVMGIAADILEKIIQGAGSNVLLVHPSNLPTPDQRRAGERGGGGGVQC